jgi:hypothetical protein
LIHDELNNGIVVTPPTGVSNFVAIDTVQSANNGAKGLWAGVGGFVTVRNSTLSGNSAGGVHGEGGEASCRWSTISYRTMELAFQSANGGQITLSNVTIAHNTGAAGNTAGAPSFRSATTPFAGTRAAAALAPPSW